MPEKNQQGIAHQNIGTYIGFAFTEDVLMKFYAHRLLIFLEAFQTLREAIMGLFLQMMFAS